MAHAEPSPRRATTRRRPGVPQQMHPAAVGTALILGIAVGAFAAYLARDGGPATFGQLWLALASGFGFAAICFTLTRAGHLMSRELRALLWGVLVGGTVGFLRSVGGFSNYRSVWIGIVIGLATILVTWYWWYTHERPSDTGEV
ncbi:hypothetical protein [Streptomyces sp. NRRL F-5126]|uniref:hypothetical protein n=1 Tax=Streptomyces sp. NRRL F-5126 TaxID=1463857 RepID=UPI0004C47FBB|nr:hypothetical protein [Streptomyces sp. NRRL F-5126]